MAERRPLVPLEEGYLGVMPLGDYLSIAVGGTGASTAAGARNALSVKELLKSALTIYVRADGSDSNIGDVNTASGAFKTVQRAVNEITKYDLGNNEVVIKIGAGTYEFDKSITLPPYVGNTIPSIVGDVTTPSNVTLTPFGDGVDCILAKNSGTWNIRGVFIRSFQIGGTGTSGIRAEGNTQINIDGLTEFGPCKGRMMFARNGAFIRIVSDLLVSGDAQAMVESGFGGSKIEYVGNYTCTLSNSPLFSLACCIANMSSSVLVTGVTFAGGLGGYAGGRRYIATTSSTIQTYGSGPYYLPGNLDGFTDITSSYDSPVATFRQKLTSPVTYYVRSDGNDENNGLVDNASGSFKTIQRAMQVVATLDLGIYDVTVNVRTGSYSGTVLIPLMMGSGFLYIIGDTTTPSNCVVTSSSNACFQAADNARCIVRGFKVSGFGGIRGIRGGGIFFSYIDFSSCSSYHMEASNGGWLQSEGNYSITGNSPRHITCSILSRVALFGGTVTLNGTPAFVDAFAKTASGSVLQVYAVTFAGTASGTKYKAISNSIIDAVGAGANYLPGSTAGSTATGGQYT